MLEMQPYDFLGLHWIKWLYTPGSEWYWSASQGGLLLTSKNCGYCFPVILVTWAQLLQNLMAYMKHKQSRCISCQWCALNILLGNNWHHYVLAALAGFLPAGGQSKLFTVQSSFSCRFRPVVKISRNCVV